MKEDPAPGAKCRDKFLVQSVVVTLDRESLPLAELVCPFPSSSSIEDANDPGNLKQWATVEKEDKASSDKPSLIHEQKIRCAYLPAAEDGTNGANGTIHEEEVSSGARSGVGEGRAGFHASRVELLAQKKRDR